MTTGFVPAHWGNELLSLPDVTVTADATGLPVQVANAGKLVLDVRWMTDAAEPLVFELRLYSGTVFNLFGLTPFAPIVPAARILAPRASVTVGTDNTVTVTTDLGETNGVLPVEFDFFAAFVQPRGTVTSTHTVQASLVAYGVAR